jgi:tape measure domain-containing protein
VANDLEIRIGAELSEIKGAIASLKKDIASVGDVKPNTSGFAAIEREAREAAKAAKNLEREKVAAAKVAQKELTAASRAAAKAETDAARESALVVKQAAREKAAAAKQAAQEAANASRIASREHQASTLAMERERQSAQRLAADLRQQAAVYNQTKVQVLELNKARDLSRIKIEAERRSVAAAYDELIRKVRQADREQSAFTRNTGAGFARLTTAVGGFLTVYGAIRAIRATTNLTDEYARITAQLNLATDSQAEFNVAQEETLRIANITRAPVQDIINTYAALERSTEELRPSQESLVRVLETVSKAIALTPVSADTSRATLTQFGQALSGDFKNGAQELNSILEQTPGLAIAIADGLGVPTSALKAMGEQGELSADLVFNALQRISSDIDQKFTEIPTTVSGAMTQMRNDIVTALGPADVAPLVEGIQTLRDTLTDPAVKAGLLALAEGLLTVAAAGAEATSGIVNFITSGAEGLSRMFNGIASNDIPAIERKINTLKNAIDDLQSLNKQEIAAGGNKFVETRLKQIELLQTELQKMQDLLALNQEPEVAADAESADAKVERLRKEAEARMEIARATRTQQAEEEKLAKAAEQRQKQVTDTIASLQAEADTYGMSAEEIVRYQLAALGATDVEINRAAALANTLDQLKKKEQAEKDSVKAAEDRIELEKKLAGELIEVQLRTLEGAGQGVTAARIRLQQEFAELIRNLQAVGNEAGVELVQKLINTEEARIQFDELKRQFDEVVADLQARQESLANQVTVGAITPSFADEQQREARDVALQQLRQLTEQMQALAAATGEEGLVRAADAAAAALGRLEVEGMTGLEGAIAGLRASWDQMQRKFAESTVNAGVDSLTNFFTNLATGAKTGGEALRDFVRSFATSMAQIAARALATFLVLQLLDAVYPGLGKITAATMSVGVQHAGGMAGSGPKRKVSPLLFANAPRFHNGSGVLGLKYDEIPAILQTGERVQSREEVAAMNKGQGGSRGVRIVNLPDKDLARDFLESSSGEEVVLNILERNGMSPSQRFTG